MADVCRAAQNSVALQGDMFRLAERDHGLSLKALCLKTGIPAPTLKSWRSGTVMPAWALFKLGRDGGIPDELLSLIGEPFERHVGTDESGDGDLDTAANDALDFAQAVSRARHPASPGGVQIVPQEVAVILPLAKRVCASVRRAA